MVSSPLLSCLSLLLVALSSPVAALWPAPLSYTKGSSVLYLHQNLKVTYNGQSVRWSPSSVPSSSSVLPPSSSCPAHDDVCPMEQAAATAAPPPPAEPNPLTHQIPYTYGYVPSKLTSKEVVQAGVSRALAGIFSSQFVPWKLHKPHSSWEPDVSKGKAWLQTLQIVQSAEDKPAAFKPLAGDVDESYNLTVSAEGAARLDAVSSIGGSAAWKPFPSSSTSTRPAPSGTRRTRPSPSATRPSSPTAAS